MIRAIFIRKFSVNEIKKFDRFLCVYYLSFMEKQITKISRPVQNDTKSRETMIQVIIFFTVLSRKFYVSLEEKIKTYEEGFPGSGADTKREWRTSSLRILQVYCACCVLV